MLWSNEDSACFYKGKGSLPSLGYLLKRGTSYSCMLSRSRGRECCVGLNAANVPYDNGYRHMQL